MSVTSLQNFQTGTNCDQPQRHIWNAHLTDHIGKTEAGQSAWGCRVAGCCRGMKLKLITRNRHAKSVGVRDRERRLRNRLQDTHVVYVHTGMAQMRM